MKNICLITHHPFWLEPLGCGTAMRDRYRLLSSMFDNIYVLFITSGDQKSPLPGGTLKVNSHFTLEAIDAVRGFLKNHTISVCYFSYDQFGFLLDYINCITAVEIHDVMHLRQKQFEKYGYTAPYQTNKDKELQSLKRYNFVFSLNKNEVNYLHENGINQAHYLPPNASFKKLKEPSDKSFFGLIGSQAKPNVDGLREISDFCKQSKNFVLAGPLAHTPEALNIKNESTVNLGVVNDVTEFYGKVNLAISPVRFGGGLKIKVFEALSFGRSVLATKHAIDGFPEGIENVVAVEDDLCRWSNDILYSAMQKSSKDVEEYFKENFQENKCRNILKKLL